MYAKIFNTKNTFFPPKHMFMCLVGFPQKKKKLIISPYRIKTKTISSQPSPLEIMVDRRQPEIVKYYRYLDSMTTNDIRFIWQIKYRIAMEKIEFNKKRIFSPANWS